MDGKRIKVNDFKFKYGQETIFINVYGAFKYKKNGKSRTKTVKKNTIKNLHSSSKIHVYAIVKLK